MVFFDDTREAFETCVKYTGDREYCAKVVELLTEVQTRRVFDYGGRVRFRAFLPQHARRYAVVINKRGRVAAIFIGVIGAAAMLFYEIVGDEFKLKFVDWITTELKALKNPHPATFTQQ